MKNKVQSQKEMHLNSKPLYSIIPLVDEANSKALQENELTTKEDSNEISKEERKQILRKIIFSAKSSNYLQKPTITDTDQTLTTKELEAEENIGRIKKNNSDFPTQRKMKNDDLQKSKKRNSAIPNSISDSRISEKDAQNNSRRIVFLLKASSNFPNDDLIEQALQEPGKKDSNIKNSNSDFPKKFNFGHSPEKENENKAKISRKSIQAAKSSNNLQNTNLISPKQKISEENNEKTDKIKKSNSDFPSPKKQKSETLLKAADDEAKNQQGGEPKAIKKSSSTSKSSNALQNENDTKLKTKYSEGQIDKIKKFNSDFPVPKKLDVNDSPNPDQIKNKENAKKIPRKAIEPTKSTNIIQNTSKSEQKSLPKASDSNTDKIKKFNSDFPTQKKLETEPKINKDKENSNKIPRKPITSTKSSIILQNQIKIDQNPSPEAEESKAVKIKKVSSDFPTQRKIKIEDAQNNSQSKTKEANIKDKENVNKIPRKPIASTKSSSNLPNQNNIDQKNSTKTDESKADKIKKVNSDFSVQKKLDSEPKTKENANKIPRKIIESTKSSNTIQKQSKNDQKLKVEDQKSDKIKKYNSDLPTNKKIENDDQQKEEKIEKKKPLPSQNTKTNPTLKEIDIEIEIGTKESKEKIESKRPNNEEDQKSPQKDDQQSPKKVVKDFLPRNNSPSQSPSNNTTKQPIKNAKKQSNTKKQELDINLAEPSKNNQTSKNNSLKIKNIQVEYKNDKNKQDQKPKENTNNQKNPVINIQQNQKQKLNIVIKTKDKSQQPKENTNIQTKEIEKTKDQSQQPNTKIQTKENTNSIQQKEIEKPKVQSQQPNTNIQTKDQSQQQNTNIQTKDQSQQQNTNIQTKEIIPQPQKETEKTKSNSKRSSRTKENRFLWKGPATPPPKEAQNSTSPNDDEITKQQSQSTETEPNESQSKPTESQQQQPTETEIIQKETIPFNEKSKLSEEMKKQIMDEIEKSQQNITQASSINSSKQKNIFTFKMCIESQPICIAVGDIEGDVDKLTQIVSFIRSNPTLHFVFIGDIIDDLSDACPSSSESWSCLSLLSEFFVTGSTFSLDNTDTPKSDTLISLPSSFCEISFREVKYGNIRNRVKFLAGNAECDNLLDFQKPCEIVPGEVTNYIFGQGRWKKTVTFDKMCLLYRYLKSCFGIIKMKKNPPENKKNSVDFIDTVYFRHSPSSFKINRFPKNMYFPNPDLKKTEIERGNFFFITGHARIFASISSQKHENKEMFYVVDTTVLDAQNQYLKDVGGFGTNDRRLAVVSFDKDVGFSVKAISLPCPFPKSTLKCKISDKYIQIKGI